MVILLCLSILLAAWVSNPLGPAAILALIEGWWESRSVAKKAKEEK